MPASNEWLVSRHLASERPVSWFQRADQSERLVTLAEVESRLNKLEAKVRELEQWKEVITDIAVVDWALTAETAENAYKCIHDIVQARLRMLLDPAVSEQAAKVAELEAKARRAEGLERAVERFLADFGTLQGTGRLGTALDAFRSEKGEGA